MPLMFTIIYKPTETVVSTHSTREVAEQALIVVQTTIPSHEIIETEVSNE